MSCQSFARAAALAVVALSPLSLPAAAAGPRPSSPAVAETHLAHPVACWWRNGVRRCDGDNARHGYRHYGYGPSYGYRPSYGYGAPRPEQLPFGSTAWWRAMDREGRGGYRN